MNTDADTPKAGTNHADLSPSVVFSLLAHPRRRHALAYLAKRVGGVPLGEVAEHVALAEGDPSRDRYERIVTGLYHAHLPGMIEAGIVRYDPDRETVALVVPPERIAPYLDLAEADAGGR